MESFLESRPGAGSDHARVETILVPGQTGSDLRQSRPSKRCIQFCFKAEQAC